MAPAPDSPWGGVLDHTRVSLAQHKIRLDLATGHEVFSGAGIDVGTQLLLRTLDPSTLEGVSSVFDLGCGYGPLGLALGARTGSAILMDRDAVAVAYSRLNADANAIGAMEVVPGLGWADLPAGTEPDLMVSNIPAKAGPKVIEQMLVAGPILRRAVVVVERLAAEAEGVLGRAGAEVTLRKANRTHVVVHYRLAEGRPAKGEDAHLRGTRKFQVGKLGWEADTAWGLPEFDTLTHSTGLAIRVLRGVHPRPGMTALVVEPGQGHLPLVTAELIRPEAIRLCSRDLLALRWSRRNLTAAGFEEELHLDHSPLPEGEPESIDLAVLNLPDKLPHAALAEMMRRAARQLRPAGRLIGAGSSTTVQRMTAAADLAKLPLIALDRIKDKGDSAADFVRR